MSTRSSNGHNGTTKFLLVTTSMSQLPCLRMLLSETGRFRMLAKKLIPSLQKAQKKTKKK